MNSTNITSELGSAICRDENVQVVVPKKVEDIGGVYKNV